MPSQFVKIVVFVPTAHADKVREAMAQAGAGHIGNYDFCSFSSKGIGRFRPLTGTKPTIGQIGKLEEVEEERIETICPHDKVKDVIAAIKSVHLYEEPAIDIYPLENI